MRTTTRRGRPPRDEVGFSFSRRFSLKLKECCPRSQRQAIRPPHRTFSPLTSLPHPARHPLLLHLPPDQELPLDLEDPDKLDKMVETNTLDKHEKGPCCVCGEETKNRCGPCAEAGTTLFFCSKVHQKLVWFNHKRVCGTRSTPFRLPPLSASEALAALQNLDTVPPVRPQNSARSIREALDRFLPPHKGILGDRACALAIDSMGKDSYTPELGLIEIRRFSWLRTWAKGYGVPRAAFDALANLESGISVQIYGSPEAVAEEVPQPWVSTFRHKALVLFTLSEVYRRPDRPLSFSQVYLFHAHRALQHYIHHDVAAAAGEETAKQVRTQLDDVFKCFTIPFEEL